MNTPKTAFLLFCSLLSLSGCKKTSQLDPLSNVVLAKTGVIRVECAECTIDYTVSGDNFQEYVKNSEDISFSYVSDFQLKTSITTTKKQLIRLAIFDAYGRLISNELSSLDKGSAKNNTFAIKLE